MIRAARMTTRSGWRSWKNGRPVVDGQPGTIVTRVFETVANPSGNGTQLDKELSTSSPPAGLEDHPFMVSARTTTGPGTCSRMCGRGKTSAPSPCGTRTRT